MDRLKRQKQLNVQEQNALTRQSILECAQAFISHAPHLTWVSEALQSSCISPESGILISASSVPCGGDEAAARAQWLTAEGRFYILEASVLLGTHALVAVEAVEEVTAQVSTSGHERGIGKSSGALALEVLAELTGANKSFKRTPNGAA